MTRRRWALLACGLLLAAFLGFAALDGGRNCQVPRSGPFHWLLQGHKFVATRARTWRIPACRQLR